ncbi:periplasmic protein involved in polysaccharide export [Spongiibacter sp. IMCC21906]|uniref:polysaccharide export protein n=1 Tax=Spongiibacter sp. IMCC21906 TaxID=1620392 RepID=UPI00062DEFCE|nr:polysaccharide export protein [Spongiibacter sp. IMCC21906]AKH67858.1 periplasmic protein involved in polysaccharide export [Spongiibacter sp. IMCC21906]
MKVSTFLAGALILTTAGCTVVPGSDMGRINSVWFDDTPEDYKPASTNIDYIPINATVLSHLKSQPDYIPQRNAALEQAIDNYNYRIGPGDVLTIIVWEHPELTIPAGSFRTAAEGGNEVKADGTIFYPYAGTMAVAGKTTAEVQHLLRDKLKEVIKKPQVDVRLADFRSQRVYVSGAVQQPGVVPVTAVPLTLLDAIEQQGGLAANASWQNIQFTRNGETRTISLQKLYEKGSWSENLLLQNGDLIHVPRNDADKIFVLGEVNIPQGMLMSRNGTTLAEALATARGINENRADGRGIYVLRNAGVSTDEDGLPVYNATVYHLNANSAVGFMLADSFPLQARDVVYVAPAPITKWNRFLSQLLPTILATDSIGDVENN